MFFCEMAFVLCEMTSVLCEMASVYCEKTSAFRELFEEKTKMNFFVGFRKFPG